MSYEKSIVDIVRANMSQYFDHCEGLYSLKMDEIALNPRIRWSPYTNEIVGFCYNHKDNVGSFQFINHLILNDVKKKFLDQKIHLAKDALCIAINKIDSNDTLIKPILLIPLCGKTFELLPFVVKTIIDMFKQFNPKAVMVNISTDGDTYRRKTFNELREASNEIFFSNVKYFSNQFVYGQLGLNFDVKHLVKRIRGILISEKRSIHLIKRSFGRDHIAQLYPSLRHLLNPKDYQNVPFAVKLFEGLLDDKNKITIDNEIYVRIYKEVDCLNEIMKPLLNIFVNPTINLLDQLTQLAYCSHLMFFIYRKWKNKFLTKDLYLDIQSTIQDAFICAELFNRCDKNAKLYLYQLGTDQLESFFGLVRTVTHNVNCDILELQERIKTILQLESVYLKHPNWKRPSRVCKSTYDHSSVASWVGKLDASDINKHMLKYIWNDGFERATEYLKSVGYSDDDFVVRKAHVNILHPLDKQDDVDDEEEEFSDDFHLHLDEHDDDVEELISNDIYCNKEKIEATFAMNGCVVYKANAIANVIHSTSRLSKSRVKRVMGISDNNFEVIGNSNSELDDNLILITDVLATVALNLHDNCLFLLLFTIDKIFINSDSRESVSLDSFSLASFNGTGLKLNAIDETCVIWKGDYIETINDIAGAVCYQIKSNVINKDGDLTLTLLINELSQIKDYLHQQVQCIGVANMKFPKLKIEFKINKLSDFLKIEEPVSASATKFKCKLCRIDVKKERMRQHIGKHILSQDLTHCVNMCGFCGMSGCKIDLKATSGYGNYQTMGADSDCQYFYNFSLKAASKATKRSPCSNRPIMCLICNHCYQHILTSAAPLSLQLLTYILEP